MKKILIYYSYSQKNAGDMAICLGLLDLLSDIPGCQITMVSRYANNDPLFVESKQLIKKYHPSIIEERLLLSRVVVGASSQQSANLDLQSVVEQSFRELERVIGGFLT